jgi:type I restriction enzyme S subunit
MSFPRYPKYKHSGVEWLGEVPEHWAVSRLKYVVACLTTGGTPDTSTPEFWADAETSGVPWVSIGDMTREPVVHTTEKRLTAAGVAAKRLDVLPAGTLLYSMFASLGKVATLGVPAAINQAILGITPNDERVTNAFLKHWLAFLQSHIEQFSSSNTQDNLNAGKVRAFPVVVANTSEQAAITSFLDRETAKIDALIAEQQRLIELLQEKRQAVISHAVTKGLNPDVPMKDSGIEWLGEVPEHWKTGRCRFYVDMLSGFAFPSQGFSDDEADWRLLRGINVGVGSIRWEDIFYWKREPDDGLNAYEMRQGDLVIGMDRPLISDGMRVARLTEQDVPSLLLQRVVRLTPLPPIDAEYLQHLLSSEMFVAHFAPETTGVSVPHISPDQIAAFVIPVPPIDEQKAIVKQVSEAIVKLAGLMNQARQSVDLLQERRSALISAAVTGQIDVRNYNREGAAA